MNIVIAYDIEDPIIVGLTATTQTLDENIVAWNPAAKSVYDMFDEIKPDVILINGKQVTPAFLNILKEYKSTDIVLFGLSFIEQIKPRLLCLPSNIHKNIISKLEAQKTNYLFIDKAANIAQYRNGQKLPEYECDLFYWSNYPVNNFDILQKLCQMGYKIKMGGQHRIPLPQYIGQLNIHDVSNFMASTKVALDFDNNNIFDYAANKTFCLTGQDYHFYPTFNLTDINYYIERKDKRAEVAYEAYIKIINNHTYFHRLNSIFSKLGLKDLEEKSTAVLKQLVEGDNK